MPGHKLGKGFPSNLIDKLYLLDVTEIPGLDDLHNPTGIIREAQELTAKAYGSDIAFFSVNGSTCGIQAAIMTVCKPGDKLIVARDCHKSVIAGMMLAGVRPVYIKPEFEKTFNIPGAVNISQVRKALEENPDTAGVLITRPNYYGICCDIEAICHLVHTHNKVIIVDEAHGAHLKFSQLLPDSSLEYGADICIQSAHKTLPAFTQGSYVHVKGNLVDAGRLKLNLSLIETSSPSYIIMAFLDIARAIMECEGKEAIDTLLGNIRLVEEKINENSSFMLLTEKAGINAELDRTRIVINVSKTGKTGFEVGRILRENYNIQIEMADLYNIVCIATIANTKEDFTRLCTALFRIERNLIKPAILSDINIGELGIPELKLDLREVMYSRSVWKNISEASGMTSKGIVTPYPPGVPVICPGEEITEKALEYLKHVIDAGGVVNGVSENMEIEVVAH